ncbi:flagellar M-ring protein FliF [Peribacillus deserti]|uniref:Flagellar M-ring protein n=1 Tax=Peribacillus deserti TaxID=673318 RepID=A0ABS2QGH8_9BACI|nr:flagellar basal-body MS-ring/collar protein FliF [Peribacillus deserti]MBM7692268.1 flagellar M-ring protein FliF [Peribacillus deserti]
MNEFIANLKNRITGFWSSRTKKQKTVLISSVILVLVLIAAAALFSTRKNMVPLYSNLAPSETGTIKQNLDGRGIPSEIADGGKTILVPEENVDSLKVELAAEGIPESGSIDYSFFSKNAGFGMTDNEFQVVKLDSMQTELTNLIKGIDGVEDAKVMLSLPEKGIFVSDTNEEASASIVLKTKPGYQFQDGQIKSLYHLVSKSVPNLPTDNIVIMNQNFEYFDLKNENNFQNGTIFTAQHEMKKEVERDIQRQVQNMLGTLMGRDKVVVSVTADIDFTQENREENLVEPVDKENMKGIALSAQKITETFTGTGNPAGGTPEGEDPSDSLGTQYLEGSNGNGDYEKIEDTINYEVNKIKKEIVESPYKVRDLGIQVMVEPPKKNDRNSLPQERIDDITKVLGTIVRTSIDKDYLPETVTEEDIDNKIAVSVQPFNGKMEFDSETNPAIPLWAYITGGVLLLALAAAIILFLRSRRKDEEEEYVVEEQIEFNIPDVTEETETEATARRKQLEKLAKEKPDEFAKLLRSWITEE